MANGLRNYRLFLIITRALALCYVITGIVILNDSKNVSDECFDIHGYGTAGVIMACVFIFMAIFEHFMIGNGGGAGGPVGAGIAGYYTMIIMISKIITTLTAFIMFVVGTAEMSNINDYCKSY